MPNIDTQKTVTLIGAVVVGLAFLAVVIAPILGHDIPAGTANVVFAMAGGVFGFGASNYTAAQAQARTLQAMGKQ